MSTCGHTICRTTEPCRYVTTVRASASYACGRESSRDVEVRTPVPGETLDSWWEDVVHPHMGDGHACGSSEHALYEARVLCTFDPELNAGDTRTWEG